MFSRRNGISIRMEDEWIDLLQNVILDIHRHYPMFANAELRCECLLYGDDNEMGWKACTVFYPFGRNSDYEDSNCGGDYIWCNFENYD